MTRLLLMLSVTCLLFSCSEKASSPSVVNQITYSIEDWESLGSQTLVVITAENLSASKQDITFRVEAKNSQGVNFITDSTVCFQKNQAQKELKFLLETSGEIKDVFISTYN
ncbi:MAG: hypothetical protein WDZ35_06355 [Crocinitomicaceae bacterium]